VRLRPPPITTTSRSGAPTSVTAEVTKIIGVTDVWVDVGARRLTIVSDELGSAAEAVRRRDTASTPHR
jgi:hypothetical protein